ncbi:MAG TPA: hypothetical protein PLQ20_01775 [Candidatus Paceibacterota bacterium]|nr:hypothetical protein [Candidatus Paceibacterota bacterium]
MKKLINFAVNTKNGQKILLATCLVIMVSLVIGIILSVPAFWMGNKYDATWMKNVAPYFFYAFFGYAALMFFLFIPYLWYVGNSNKYTGDARGLMKGMAIFCSIVPGGFIYSSIAKALFIPTGPHSILGILMCGLIYLWIIKTIFKKPFATAQTFIPLC